MGATTTYLAAIKDENTSLVASLAAATTVVGTLEKTFGFGKKWSGYRNAKTQFQNLELDVMKLDDNNIPDSYWEKLKEIRKLKSEITD